jgi:hypothetical protein
MYVLILTFILLGPTAADTKVNTSSTMFVFKTQADCEKQLAITLPYQMGVHAKDGWNVNAFCRPVDVTALQGA